MCFYADSLNAPTGDGLTLEEMEKVSKSLPNLMQLTMTGGEPFLRKDLAKIVGYFYENSGVRNFTIPTNGTYTDKTREVMSEVLTKYPAATFKLGISLDGPKEYHNKIRGSERSFDSLSKTHALLKEMQKQFPNLIITMSGVISSFNLHVAKDLIDLYFENFPSDDYTVQFARGNTKDPAAKTFEANEYRKCVDYLEARKLEVFNAVGPTKTMVRKLTTRTREIVSKTARDDSFQVNCVAGSRLVVLYDTGVLTPCEILGTWNHPADVRAKYNGFNYGNVREFDCDVQKAVDSRLGQSIKSHIKDTKCRCTFECAIIASIFYQPTELMKTLAGTDLSKIPTLAEATKTIEAISSTPTAIVVEKPLATVANQKSAGNFARID
jgi:sulfatase maturation enzyme AslB (radical SAM superfamily)